jgi:hypothetical protein
MVYAVGLLGFICGFCLMLLVLNALLRGVPRTELLGNKALQIRYGLLTWGVAAFSAWAATFIYKSYFLS